MSLVGQVALHFHLALSSQQVPQHQVVQGGLVVQCCLVVQSDLQHPQVRANQQDLVVLHFPLAPLAPPLPEGQRDQVDQVVLEGQQDRPSHLFLALHGR